MISSQISMRRFENGTHDPAMISAILDQSDIVHVGCFDEEYPYVVPLSFGYEIRDGKLLVYLHCAREGHKIDLWRKNPHVALTFSMFYNHPDRLYRGCMHDFRSVMALGTIAPVDRKAQAALHGTAVQTILRQNDRKPTQFSVPHYMWMQVYVVTCDMKDVTGKFENPIENPEEVPFPDVYSLPENKEPYDVEYFYHRKPYPEKEGVWKENVSGGLPVMNEGDGLFLPDGDVELTVRWSVKPGYPEADFDLSALLLNEDGKVSRRYDMVFYNQTGDRSNTVCHTGDDAAAEEKGSEGLRIHMGAAPDCFSKIVVSLSGFMAGDGKAGLEILEAVSLTVTDSRDGTVIFCRRLETEGLSGPAASLVSISRKEDGWYLDRETKRFGSWRILDQAREYGLAKWKE